MQENPTVGVVGLGYVGSCVAAVLADRGLNVVGVDTDPQLIEELTEGYCRFAEGGLPELLADAMAAGRLTVTAEYSAMSAADLVLVTVGTPVNDDGSLADAQLRGACRSLSAHLRPGHLVVVKSTVPPGTTRELVLPLLESGGLTAGVDFQLAFSPERLAQGNAVADLRNLPMVVGGLDSASTRAAADFWRQALDVEVLAQDSMEAAEIIKLADNWWIDLNIALANELSKYCALFDIDVLDVIAAANTIPKGNGHVNILLPSVGVGGSCLTKDPWMVQHSARREGLELHTPRTGREVNDAMPGYAARLVVNELEACGKQPAEARIAVLGVAFKNNTGDLRATPTQGVIAALCELGADVRVYDPLVDPAQVKELLGLHPAATLREAVLDADCLAILALHRQFEDIDFSVLPVADPCVIVDGRAYYPKEKIAAFRRMGYRYRGIGR